MIRKACANIGTDRGMSQTRSFAAVLFRRISTKTRRDPGATQSKELFLTLQQPSQNAIRAKLLDCLQVETLSHVRNKIGDAVAEIARQYTDEGTACHLKMDGVCQVADGAWVR